MDATTTENINLLIIDSTENITTLMSSLVDENFNIFTTKSAQQAFQICIDNDIAIAIIAMEMTDMNGYDLLDQIKNNPLTEHILVIFTIDYSSNSDSVVKGLSKGAIDYLHKPFDLSITIAKIH